VTITVDPQRAADVRSLNDLLDGIVERVIAGYDAAGVSLPDRRYWTMQAPAWDCEQMVGCIPGLQPRGKAPTVEQIESAARALGIDAWLLLDISADFDMWENFGPGMGVIATVDVGEPEGGFQAVTLHVTLAIP
jgi:hypothetical protein